MLACSSDSVLVVPALLCLCLALAATPINTIIYGQVFQAISKFASGTYTSEELTQKVWSQCTILIAVSAGRLVVTWILVILYLLFGERIQARARALVYFDGILGAPMARFDEVCGVMGKISQVNRCFEEIRAGYADSVAILVELVAVVVGLFVTAMVHSWSLTLVVVALAPVMAAFTWWLGGCERHYGKQEMKSSQMASKTLDWCFGAGSTFVRLFNGLSWEMAKFKASVNISQFNFTMVTVYGQSYMAIVMCLTMLAFAQGFWFGNSMISQGKLLVSQVFTCFSLCLILGQQLSVILKVFPFLFKAAVAEKYIRKFADDLTGENVITTIDEEKVAVVFDGVTFAYPSRLTETVLEELSFTITPGFTFIVGQLGCGKSTIAQLMVALYFPVSGTIRTPPLAKITLVEQFAAIFPGLLVFDNIAMLVVGSQYRQLSDVPNSAIDDAVKMAVLDEVVVGLSSGMDTKLESGQLLGGQHQRLVIARAYLRNTPVLILDEAFLALDSTAKKAVMANLRKWRDQNQITVIITHDYSEIGSSDRVIQLGDGKIVHDGLGALVPSPQPSTTTVITTTGHHQIDRDIVETEEPSQLGVLQIMRWFVCTCPSKLFLIGGIFWAVVVGIANPAFLFYFSNLLQVMVSGSSGHYLMQMSCAVIGIAVITGIAQFLSGFLLAMASEQWLVDLRILVATKLCQQPVLYLKASQVAEVTAQIMNDSKDLRGLTSTFITVVVSVVIMVSGGMIWALVCGWKLALVGVAFIPLVAAITVVYSRIMSKFERCYKDVVSRVENLLWITTTGLKTVKVNGLEPYFAKLWEDLQISLETVGFKRSVAMGFAMLVNGLIVAIAQSCLLYFASKLVASGEYNSRQMVQTITMFIFTLTGAMAYLQGIPKIARGKRCGGLLFHYLNLEPLAIQVGGIETPVVDGLQGEFLPAIQFCAVLFAHQSSLILHDVDFSIHANEFVAIVGPLGSGKSTICSLMCRLVVPDVGKVQLFGIDIAKICPTWIHSQVAVVSQSPQFFEGTIFENLVAYLEVVPSEEKIWEALELVEMAATVRKAGGLLCRVGETNTSLLLSGGQLQRLAISRALLRKPKILILDECTSALDPISADVVSLLLQEKLAGKLTIVAITHSCELAKMANRQLVMNGGYIYEEFGN